VPPIGGDKQSVVLGPERESQTLNFSDLYGHYGQLKWPTLIEWTSYVWWQNNRRIGDEKLRFTDAPPLWKHLPEAVTEWRLQRGSSTIPVTTDDAKKYGECNATAGLGPHIGCFAHTVYLAAKNAVSISQVSGIFPSEHNSHPRLINQTRDAANASSQTNSWCPSLSEHNKWHAGALFRAAGFHLFCSDGQGCLEKMSKTLTKIVKPLKHPLQCPWSSLCRRWY